MGTEPGPGNAFLIMNDNDDKTMLEIEQGTSVQVKEGIVNPDDESINIGGWQGWVLDTWRNKQDETMVKLQWDSLVLEELPENYIIDSEKKGLSWDKMILKTNEVKLTEPRDTENEVQKTYRELHKKYHWYGLKKQGERIKHILEDVNESDKDACLRRWKEHLENILEFPVEAIIDQTIGLKNDVSSRDSVVGDSVRIRKIVCDDDWHRLIVRISSENEYTQMLLINLRINDEKPAASMGVSDYRTWEANS